MTVGALKTTVLDIIIAPFIFLDVLVIIQDRRRLLFSPDLMRIPDPSLFLRGLLELRRHRQSCCGRRPRGSCLPCPCTLRWAARRRGPVGMGQRRHQFGPLARSRGGTEGAGGAGSHRGRGADAACVCRGRGRGRGAVGHPGFPTCPGGREGPGRWKRKREIFWRLLAENLGVSLSSAGFFCCFGCCWFFFFFPFLSSSSLRTSLFPRSQASVFLGNPSPTRGVGSLLPRGGHGRGQEGSGSRYTVLGQGRPERDDPAATARALCASAL